MKLHTFGYSNWKVDELEAEIVKRNIVVIDCRLVPYSRRKPEWNKMALAARFDGRYRWVRSLGNINYNDHNKPIELCDPKRGIELFEHLSQRYGGSFALMCTCKDYDKCHRKLVVSMLLYHIPELEYCGELEASKPKQMRLF